MKIPTKRGYTIMELFVVLTIVGILAAVFFPIFTRRPDHNHRLSCTSNLKRLGLAMIQYTQDYDEKFPPLALHAVASSTDSFSKRPYGWADAIQPYARNLGDLQCPSEANQTPSEDATQSGYTDYWMNTNLNARPLKEISSSWETFLLGEGNDGNDGTDARYNRNVLPQRWLDEENSPSWRHSGAGNYLFADGHVKAAKPNAVVASNSFAVQRQ